MKTYDKIVKHGRLKNFLNEHKKIMVGFDLETVDNEIVLMGKYDDAYTFTTENFFEFFLSTVVECGQLNHHIATWSRYDNTHLLKLLMQGIDEKEKEKIIERIGKNSGSFDKKTGVYLEPPLLSIKYLGFTIHLENVIRDCLLFRIVDSQGKNTTVWSYNIKNLYVSGLEKVAMDNELTYYSKIDKDAHLIDLELFNENKDYRNKVLLSNELDCRAVMDLGHKVQDDFYEIMGSYPNNLISAGSLARSSVIAFSHKLDLSTKHLNVYSIINEYNRDHLRALDYGMRAYHGGKIDSYVLGYTKHAYMIDLTSAYPSAMRELKGFNKHQLIFKQGKPKTTKYNYMFVRCNLNIKRNDLSTPFIIQNPLNNNSNLNPWGIIRDIVLTKNEYEFTLKNGEWIECEELDYIYIVSDNEPILYKPIIDVLFQLRMKYKKEGKKSLDELTKTIINSLYGITYELTETYNNDLEMIGYRAGDFFNPFIASHITGETRTKIAEMNNQIIQRGGKILLNMTDSIMYEGAEVSELCSEVKTLGTFEKPDEIHDIIILGSGRYEYMKEFNYIYKTRGFTASIGTGSYYGPILRGGGKIVNSGFVTPFKSMTKEFTSEDIGLIYETEYSLNPFNLGGKRIVRRRNLDLTKERIDTEQVYLNENIWQTKNPH